MQVGCFCILQGKRPPASLHLHPLAAWQGVKRPQSGSVILAEQQGLGLPRSSLLGLQFVNA